MTSGLNRLLGPAQQLSRLERSEHHPLRMKGRLDLTGDREAGPRRRNTSASIPDDAGVHLFRDGQLVK